MRIDRSPHPGFLENGQDPGGGPFPAYSAGKSWDEVLGKTSSEKKFHRNVPILSEQQLVDSGTVDRTTSSLSRRREHLVHGG